MASLNKKQPENDPLSYFLRFLSSITQITYYIIILLKVFIYLWSKKHSVALISGLWTSKSIFHFVSLSLYTGNLQVARLLDCQWKYCLVWCLMNRILRFLLSHFLSLPFFLSVIRTFLSYFPSPLLCSIPKTERYLALGLMKPISWFLRTEFERYPWVL